MQVVFQPNANAGLSSPSVVNELIAHAARAGVRADAITWLCSPNAGAQKWIDDLSDEAGDVSVEVHDPNDRDRLSYLATTKGGRRIYLNRTLIDSDQAIVLTKRGYDLYSGYSGGELALESLPAGSKQSVFSGHRR